MRNKHIKDHWYGCVSSSKYGTNHNLPNANKSYQNVVRFKYLGTTTTDHNSIHEGIKCRLNMGNVCYMLCRVCRLPSTLYNTIKTYKTITSALSFCTGMKHGLSYEGKNTDWGCLRTGCQWGNLDIRQRKWQEVEEDCIMRSFITCTLHQKLFKSENQEG